MRVKFLPIFLTMVFFNCFNSDAFELDADQLTIPTDVSSTPFNKIHYLTVEKGASENIFDGPVVEFPNLKTILIADSTTVDKHLSHIVDYYSWLPGLGINQKEPLSDIGANKISELKVRDFSVDFPAENPVLLGEKLPKTLRSLLLGPNNNLTDAGPRCIVDLPNLSKLDIRGAKLDGDMLTRWSMPNLKHLYFANVVIGGGVLIGLEKYHKLKTVVFEKTAISASVLDELRKRHIGVRIVK